MTSFTRKALTTSALTTVAGFAAFVAAVLFVAGTIVGQQGPVAPSTTTELLREFHDESGTLLIGAILASLGLMLT
ncbi:MAG TPA: hypothetical protein VHN20_18445, partial [Beijerinckiaceae bacterium]|nr:hypothetical protein [Beijerinckiaceae bacterium]